MALSEITAIDCPVKAVKKENDEVMGTEFCVGHPGCTKTGSDTV